MLNQTRNCGLCCVIRTARNLLPLKHRMQIHQSAPVRTETTDTSAGAPAPNSSVLEDWQ